MEKLTIEQKAEAYDEVLERAKNIYGASECKDILCTLETIFPELKESEDEKIRKEIIATIHLYYGEPLEDEAKEMLAWLEKQGEHLENHDDEDILQRFSFYSYKDEPNIIYLSGLYINVEHQNKGIGTKILAIADEVAVRMGCNVIRLKTEIGSNAERLYRRNGYNIFQIEGNQVWLEKQCEKIPVVEFNAKDWYISKVDGKIYNAKFMEKTPTNQVRKLEIEKAAMSATGIIEQEEWFIKGAEWSDKNPCYISSEKPNKQKPINNQFTPEQASVLDKHVDKFLGQEPADKVEPKFHKGDWIVWQDKCYKVNYNGCGYELIDQNGLSTYLEYGTVDTSARLWDITKDAKEGDVLAAEPIGYSSTFVAIYKKQNEGDFDSYCFIGHDGKFYKGENGHSTEEVYPASKEQCELLFSKMKEAGYKWDAEKKELRKIEQRPTYKVEPKSDFELSLKHIMEEAIECGDTHNLKADAELLYNIAQKSAEWSDEDEQMVLSIEQVMNCASLLNIVPEKINKIRSWLKSLKPQLKQEWSEEDERIRQCLIRDQEEALDDVKNDKYGHSEIIADLKEMYNERIDWLKSLKQKIGG